MELLAIINGLKMLKEKCKVKIYSDSQYAVSAFNEGWLNGWIMAGWRTADKKPVKNEDLWKLLVELTTVHSVEFIKVKGHADNVKNNRCDSLARSEIAKLNSK